MHIAGLIRYRRSRVVTGPCLLLLALGSFVPAGANPVPVEDGVAVTHVQTVDPAFCSIDPTAFWDQITRATALTGELEFDVFFRTFVGPATVFQALAEWPADWEFISGELCSGAGLIEADGNQLSLDIDLKGWSDPTMLIARIVLQASTAGVFRLREGHMEVDSEVRWLGTWGAGTGVQCGSCPPSACILDVEPATLELVVSQGEQVQGLIQASTSGWDDCGAAFSVDADWISLDPVPTTFAVYDLWVTADATSLAVGMHEAQVEIETLGCKECIAIVLTVRDQTPIERRSWGAIKNSYR